MWGFGSRAWRGEPCGGLVPALGEGNRAGVRFPLPAGGTCRRGFEKFCSARSAFACTRSPDCRPRSACACTRSPDCRPRSAFACTRSPDCRPRPAFACTRSPDCRPRSAFACTRSPDCSTQTPFLSRWLARYASSQRLELESADNHFHLASVGGRLAVQQPQVHARGLVAGWRHETACVSPLGDDGARAGWLRAISPHTAKIQPSWLPAEPVYRLAHIRGPLEGVLGMSRVVRADGVVAVGSRRALKPRELDVDLAIAEVARVAPSEQPPARPSGRASCTSLSR
jgi:hypothetical protein